MIQIIEFSRKLIKNVKFGLVNLGKINKYVYGGYHMPIKILFFSILGDSFSRSIISLMF